MTRISLNTLERIASLTDIEITQNSVTILADLRGQLRHENALLSLPVVAEPVTQVEVREEPVDQVEESFKEHKRATSTRKKQ